MGGDQLRARPRRRRPARGRRDDAQRHHRAPPGRAAPRGQRAGDPALAAEQTALRRIATLVASERHPERAVRARHRGGRAPPRRAEREPPALRRGPARDGRRASPSPGPRASPSARASRSTATRSSPACSAAARRTGRELRGRGRRAGPPAARARVPRRPWPRRSTSAAGCGARSPPRPASPPALARGHRAAAARLRRARRAGARQRRRARPARRLAGAPRRGRRRRAPARRAQPPRRGPAAARRARPPPADRRVAAGQDADAARAELATAREQLDQALAELRELARGIHPAVLTDRGLRPAVDALAARAPRPDGDRRLPRRPSPEPVEAAAYYLIAEAVTNVAKYAHATHVAVSVRPENGHLVVRVSDDGVGGADPSAARGCAG